MSVVAREGCYLHYTVRGSGPSVLFIQGVGVQGDGWLPQTDDLSDGFTCISFDNRGMGRSQPIEAVITVDHWPTTRRRFSTPSGCARPTWSAIRSAVWWRCKWRCRIAIV